MLKKDTDMKWNQEARNYFQHIKQAVIKARVLVSFQFDK